MEEILLGEKRISLKDPLVMGILNLTPDSFYDGGSYLSEIAVRKRLDEIVESGGDIIDAGAYSSRPGAAHISEEEELKRLLPAMELIRKYHPDAAVSIDTFRAGVVEEIVRCYGEIIVNDISGGNMDYKMYQTVANDNLPYIMMHMQGTPQTMQENPHYKDVTKDVLDFFRDRISKLEQMGHKQIIVDPGFGFGKTLEQNYKLLRETDKFKDLGKPILVGVSRKSMIFKLLNTSPAEALTGTIAVNTLSLEKGADILRVHDVKACRETVEIFKAYRDSLNN